MVNYLLNPVLDFWSGRLISLKEKTNKQKNHSKMDLASQTLLLPQLRWIIVMTLGIHEKKFS